MNKFALLWLLVMNVGQCQTIGNSLDKCAIAKNLHKLETDSTEQGSPQSQALLDSAIKICLGYSTAYMEKSVAFNKTGDFYTGFLWLNKAVELDPLNHLGYRGWIRLRKLRDFDGAINDLQTLNKLTPNYDDYVWGEHIYYLLGECHLGLNNIDSAIFYYEKYIHLATKKSGEEFVDAYAFVYLGICEFKKKRYTNALVNFNKALKQYGKCTEAEYYKALSLYYTNKKKQALAVINQAKINFEAGYYHKDKYNEYIYQLYYSDIIESLNLISEK